MASLERNLSDYNYRRVFHMNTLQYFTKRAIVPTACEGNSRILLIFALIFIDLQEVKSKKCLHIKINV